MSQEHTMAAKPWTRLESHQSTSAISSCCFEVPNKQRTSSALSDFYVNTLAVPLSTISRKLSYHVPCDERLAGDSSHPPLPSLRLGRSVVFQPAAGLRQEELQIPVPWRYHIPEIWKRPLNSTPTSFPAGLAGVTQHRATPEPNFTKERHDVAKQAPYFFLGV